MRSPRILRNKCPQLFCAFCQGRAMVRMSCASGTTGLCANSQPPYGGHPSHWMAQSSIRLLAILPPWGRQSSSNPCLCIPRSRDSCSASPIARTCIQQNVSAPWMSISGNLTTYYSQLESECATTPCLAKISTSPTLVIQSTCFQPSKRSTRHAAVNQTTSQWEL